MGSYSDMLSKRVRYERLTDDLFVDERIDMDNYRPKRTKGILTGICGSLSQIFLGAAEKKEETYIESKTDPTGYEDSQYFNLTLIARQRKNGSWDIFNQMERSSGFVYMKLSKIELSKEEALKIFEDHNINVDRVMFYRGEARKKQKRLKDFWG